MVGAEGWAASGTLSAERISYSGLWQSPSLSWVHHLVPAWVLSMVTKTILGKCDYCSWFRICKHKEPWTSKCHRCPTIESNFQELGTLHALASCPQWMPACGKSWVYMKMHFHRHASWEMKMELAWDEWLSSTATMVFVGNPNWWRHFSVKAMRVKRQAAWRFCTWQA